MHSHVHEPVENDIATDECYDDLQHVKDNVGGRETKHGWLQDTLLIFVGLLYVLTECDVQFHFENVLINTLVEGLQKCPF